MYIFIWYKYVEGLGQAALAKAELMQFIESEPHYNVRVRIFAYV